VKDMPLATMGVSIKENGREVKDMSLLTKGFDQNRFDEGKGLLAFVLSV
jgi:hypothetical protein